MYFLTKIFHMFIECFIKVCSWQLLAINHYLMLYDLVPIWTASHNSIQFILKCIMAIGITSNSNVCSTVFSSYQIKKTSKPPITGPLRGESTNQWWIPLIWSCNMDSAFIGFPELLKHYWNSDLYQDHGKFEFHEKNLTLVELKKILKNHWIFN